MPTSEKAATRLSLLAAAKINLSLHVRGRQADGYHALESLVAFADIGDRLHFEFAEETRLSLSGPFGGALATEDNLVLRAHAALADFVGKSLPCHISLHKNLPVASGLGGGSADAAATLNGLNTLFALGLSHAELAKIAAPLGADVPVCLSSAPAWMCGIGHQVTRLGALPAADIVLVNPLQPVATAGVFAALAAAPQLTPPQDCPSGFETLDALIEFVKNQGNALFRPALSIVPDIAACLDALHEAGAAHAAMSGSGASCFALVEPGQGGDVAARYARLRPHDWSRTGALLHDGAAA